MKKQIIYVQYWPKDGTLLVKRGTVFDDPKFYTPTETQVERWGTAVVRAARDGTGILGLFFDCWLWCR